MTANFSSVNLRILSPDGKTVLAELQTLDRVNQGTARRIGDVQSAALSRVQTRAAVGARQIAGNIAQIATVGAATTQSLTGIIAQGANVAFMFGAGGAIAGAIGITALAMVSLFNRTRKEIEATSRKAMEELGRLAEAGNIGSIGGRFGVATKLFSGDRFAARREDESDTDFMIRQRGIQGGRAEVARLQRIMDESLGRGEGGRRSQALNRMLEIERALDKVIPRYEKLIALQREMEEGEGFAAGRVIAGRKVSFTASQDAAQGKRLDDLLRGGPPDLGRLVFGDGTPNRFFNPTEAWHAMVESMREGLKKTPPLPPVEMTDDLLKLMAWDQVVAGMGQQMGVTLADAIANGITAAIQTGSIGDAFKAMTGTILEGIGSMMIEAGTHALVFAKMWAKLQAWLAANPVAAIPVAIGLIAAGSAMRALGGSMRGGAAGGFGGGGSFGGGFGGAGSTIIDRGLINPLNGVVTSPGTITPRESVSFPNAVFIGTDDPRAQRQIVTMVKKGLARSGEGFG